MFERAKAMFLCPRGRSKGKMPGNEVTAKNYNNLPFMHTWKLESLFSSRSSSGKLWEYSGAFPAGGYTWKLALNLGKVEDGKSYLSLFLALLDAASPLPLHIEVAVELSILDKDHSQCSKRKVIHKIQQSKSEECRTNLLSLETLKCPSSGFLVAEIIDILIHSEQNVFLSPKPKDSSLAYTWKIDGFSKLTKRVYRSGPFLYKDHIWYLELDRTSGKDKYISLYLMLDDANTMAPSAKVRSDHYIEWVDQIKGKNEQRNGPKDFDSKAPAWGWKKFLSLDALHDPSRGLLVNDTCIIKVGFYKCDISSK